MTRVLNTRLGELIAENGRAFIRYHQGTGVPWRAVLSHTLVVYAAACLLVAFATLALVRLHAGVGAIDTAAILIGAAALYRALPPLLAAVEAAHAPSARSAGTPPRSPAGT
jgi:hypothetical protein